MPFTKTRQAGRARFPAVFVIRETASTQPRTCRPPPCSPYAVFSPPPDNHFLTSICSNFLLLVGQPSGAARAPKFFLHTYHASSDLNLASLKADRLARIPTKLRRPPLPTTLSHTTPEVGERPSTCPSRTTYRCLPPSPTDRPCTPWQLEAWTLPSCKHSKMAWISRPAIHSIPTSAISPCSSSKP